MKTKILFGISFLFLYSVTTFSQQHKNNTAFKTIESTIPIDKIFNQTIDYLQDNSFFLLSLEKQSGFIQAKTYIINKSIMSNKIGERRTLNFIIRSIDDTITKITLNIYIEEFVFHGSHKSYYYEEKGISNDIPMYKTILDGLQEYLTRQQ